MTPTLPDITTDLQALEHIWGYRKVCCCGTVFQSLPHAPQTHCSRDCRLHEGQARRKAKKWLRNQVWHVRHGRRF